MDIISRIRGLGINHSKSFSETGMLTQGLGTKKYFSIVFHGSLLVRPTKKKNHVIYFLITSYDT